MASVPVKKRGRPRKAVVPPVALDGSSGSTSDDSRSKRPRRNASKKAVANLAQLMTVDGDDTINTPHLNNEDDGGDSDFTVNEENNSEEEYDVELGGDDELDAAKNGMPDLNSNGSGDPDRPSGKRKAPKKTYAKKSLINKVPKKKRSHGSS